MSDPTPHERWQRRRRSCTATLSAG